MLGDADSQPFVLLNRRLIASALVLLSSGLVIVPVALARGERTWWLGTSGWIPPAVALTAGISAVYIALRLRPFWRTGVLLSAKGDCLVATHWDRNVIPAQRTVRLSTVASVSISERRSPAGALVTVIDVHLTSGEVIRCGRPRRAFRPQPPLQTLNEAVAAANAKATATN